MGSGRCTSIAAKTKEDILFGHNEDWRMGSHLYVVRAAITGKPGFLSVAYAGQLPGTCVGYNEKGIAFAGNSLDTKFNPDGLPKIYLLRAMLEAEKIDDIKLLMEKGERTIGNNSLIVSAKENRIVDLEWVPQKYEFIGLDDTVEYYAHANRFLTGLVKYSADLPQANLGGTGQ